MAEKKKQNAGKKNLEKQAKETWKDLKISNDFLFGKMMQDKELCKKLLEIILEVPIERIEFPENEKSIRMQKNGRGVRLDVYVLDEERSVYNVEMQASNTRELPKRSRYYQGIIDMDIIAKGETYSSLKKSYVIFICTFDLFGEGLYKYTFENRCKEDPEIRLEDGTQKIFLNATGILEDASEDMKAFLEYVNGKDSENLFVRQLRERADAVKQNKKWRKDYMMQHIRDQLKLEEGIEQGIEQGIELGRIEERIKIIKTKMLKAKGLETIIEELECEPDVIEGVRKLYEVIEKCGLESTVEEIMKVFQETYNL